MSSLSSPVLHSSKLRIKLRYTQLVTVVLLLGAVVVVILNTWLALRSLSTLNRSQQWVSHTWQVLADIERITSSLKDAENGDRGFLITGDDAYLQPFIDAQHDLPLELDALRNLTSDNPAQQLRILEMRAVIDTRLRLLEQGVQERREGKTDSVRAMVLSGTGKAEMDHLRSLAAQMQQEEDRLLAIRTQDVQINAGRARATVFLAGGLDLLLVVVIFWYLARERTLRAVADLNADRLEKLQFVSDVALTKLGSAELTTELLDRVRRVVRANSALLALFHGEDLRIETASGIDIEPGAPIKLNSGDPINSAIRDGEVVVLSDAAGVFPGSVFNGEMQSTIITPLAAHGNLKGILVAARHPGGNAPNPLPFDGADKELMSVVADRIAISLNLTAAYDAEREARRQSETNAEEVKQLNAVLEERVLQRTAELEAANRELEAFSFSVSHDLRAPLRTVDGFSLALEEDYRDQLGADGRDFIRRIRDGVQRMGQLIDALLQLSRITRADLNVEEFNIGALAADVASVLQAENPNRDIRFEIQPEMMVEADPRLVRVALENLFGNAVKFTAKTEHAVIEFGREPSGEFFIRDNGAGFDMQYADKLFVAFQRLHGDKDFKGSGIGLATVARVVRRHRGSIRAFAVLDKGATFHFTLG